MLNRRFFPLSLIAAATLAACSTTPPQNSLLDQARGSYAMAQGNPQVALLAPGELNQAGLAMTKANDAYSRRESAAEVDQLAYVAKQRVAIAEETARHKAADKTAAGAATERDKLRLESRTAEADAAQRNAAASQRNADASQRNADASQRNADASERQTLDAEARSRSLEAQLIALDAKKSPRGLVITFADVLFDTNKSELRSGGMRGVQKLADVLKEYPQQRVLIEGFTDSTGGASHNQDLSDRRASAVRTALMDTGVGGDRIANRGYGESFPAASNATAAGRQQNRRVEIIVSDDGKMIPPR